MFRNRSLAFALVAVVCCVVAFSHAYADQRDTKAATGGVVEAAKAALTATQAAYETGLASAEEIYRWSRRLMIAELKANPSGRAAVEQHVARMEKLHEHVAARFEAGQTGSVDLTATVYYLERAKTE